MLRFDAKCTTISAVLFSVACLSACHSITPPPLQQPSEESQPSIAPKTTKSSSTWRITGAIAAKRKTKVWSASLYWQQFNHDHYQIQLFGPFGQGAMIFEKNGSLATYRDGQKTIQSTHAEQLLFQETGLHLPLQQLPFWIKGFAAPGLIQSKELDPNGHLRVLKQAGYTLHYQAYITQDKQVLPTKIQLNHQDGMVKIVIKDWKFGSP